MIAMQALAEWLEKATGQDRELDVAIENIIGIARFDKGPWVPGEGHIYEKRIDPRPFTASADAALALVGRLLPGAMWKLGSGCPDVKACTHWFCIEGKYPFTEANGPTPALAILRALVAALIEQEPPK